MQLTEVFVLAVDSPLALLERDFDNILNVVTMVLIFFDQGFFNIYHKNSFRYNDVRSEKRSFGLMMARRSTELSFLSLVMFIGYGCLWNIKCAIVSFDLLNMSLELMRFEFDLAMRTDVC